MMVLTNNINKPTEYINAAYLIKCAHPVIAIAFKSFQDGLA